MTTSDTLSAGALIISLSALVFSFFTYVKDRKRNNQDQIFQEKLTSYKELLHLARTTYLKFFDIIDYIQYFNGDQNQWNKKYNKISGSYYGLAFEFKYALSKVSFIIPENICNELFELEFALTHFVTSGYHQDSELSMKAYDSLDERIDSIENLIKSDLSVNKLNLSLTKRIN